MTAIRLVRALAPFVLTAALLGLIFYFVDVGEVISHLSSIRLEFFLPAVVLMILSIALATFRYQSAIRAHDPAHTPAFWPLFQLNLLTLFATHFLPMGALADAMRMLIARRLLRVPMTQALESVVADRALAAAGLALMGLLLLPIQIAEHWPWPAVAAQGVAYGGLLAAVVAGSAAAVWAPKLLGPLAAVGQRFVWQMSAPGRALWQLAIAAGTALLVAGMLTLLAAGLGVTLPFHLALAITPAVYLSQVIPIFYAGFGSRELVLATLLVPAGVLQDSQAIALALSLGLCNLAASLPGALFAWPLLRAARAATDPPADGAA